MITVPELEFDGIAHGFFTREGGHSTGIFASLNCGLGSGDDLNLVQKNQVSKRHWFQYSKFPQENYRANFYSL